MIVLISRNFFRNEHAVNIALNSSRPKVLVNVDLGFVDVPRQYNYYVEKLGINPLDVGTEWKHLKYEIATISRKIGEAIAAYGGEEDDVDHFQIGHQESIGL